MVKALGVSLVSLLSIGALARPSPQPENSKRALSGKTLIVGIEDYANCAGTRGGEDCFYNSSNRWLLFTINTGSELGGICKNEDLNNFTWKEDQTFKDITFFESIDWPHGSWDLTVDGVDYQYNNNGETSGGLFRKSDGAKVGNCKGDLTLGSSDPLFKYENCQMDEEKIVTRRTIISCDF